MDVNIRRLLLKRYMSKYVPHRVLETCLDDLELVIDGKHDISITAEDEAKSLSRYDLSPRILHALRKEKIYNMADLKSFILCNVGFKTSPLLRMRNVGDKSVDEIFGAIPEIQKFYEELGY